MKIQQACQQQNKMPGNKIYFPNQKRCLICQKEFIPRNHRKDQGKYCSRRCWSLSRIEPRLICFCDNCGKKFKRIKHEINKAKNHFCSIECRKLYKRKYKFAKTTCDYCGQEIIKLNQRLMKYEHHFCNLSCNMKYRLKDPAFRLKISQAARLPKSEERKKAQSGILLKKWQDDKYVFIQYVKRYFKNKGVDDLNSLENKFMQAKMLEFKIRRSLNV